MGTCCTVRDAACKEIDSKLKENEKVEQSYQKLLFLGPGGSGKSTIFKQLQWLHGNGLKDYNAADMEELVKQIRHQMVSQMQDAIQHYLCTDITDESLQKAMQIVCDGDDYQLTAQMADSIQYIWTNDARLRLIFTQHHTKKVLDESTQYFWNDIDRIKATDFAPTKTDIMNIRNRTTGIIERKFTISHRNFHIFDVGGQKSERKKWIKCFHEVRAVVFVVAISSYNEAMFENENKNCMVDALELFHQTIHHQLFTDTPIVLFLNKKDLFENKFKSVPITVSAAFDDYEKDTEDYKKVVAYIKGKFEELNETPRKIYTHLTCAMEDENVRTVFDDVSHIIFEKMKQVALL